jgi:polyphosphate glucokinase
MSLVLGIDYGGSFIKAGAVDVTAGHVVGELRAVPTPPGGGVDGSRQALKALAALFPECSGPIGLAFPAVVKQGVTLTAANVEKAWIGTDAARLLRETTGRPGSVLNDAAAAGLAEMRVGAGRGQLGAVMLLTFGTGIGSSLFIKGQQWPNAELGHLQVGAAEAEHQASARVRTLEGLDFPAWAGRVNRVIEEYHRLLWPDLFIIGGGVSEHWEAFAPLLTQVAPIVPARLRQAAGVVGAALHAVEAGSHA